VGGLGAALLLARQGHEVVVVERDPLARAGSADDAFAIERPGAPQVHQTHGFLARVVVLLRERLPDVLDALVGAGCTTMSGTAALGPAQPGDEDLAIVLVRRSTFEWILRRTVEAEAGVEVRSGVGVAALRRGRDDNGVPSVAGVTLEDGSELGADMVVAATGRRGDPARWLAPLGVPVPETVHESGLVYLTRWYRTETALTLPPAPKLGGDLGYLKFLIVPGDARMLSATLAVPANDTELRRHLAAPASFERTCRTLPGPDEWFDQLAPEPVGGVRPMGGLINRLRTFVDDGGRPIVVNFHAVGDAHTCTNPLYGRGCALALVQAAALADAALATDPLDRATTYEEFCHDQVAPWFRHAVELDRAGADPAGGAPDSGYAERVRAVLAAGQTDPVIGRAMARLWNLIALPAELDGDGAFRTRAAEIMADPLRYPAPDPGGPTRDQLLEALVAHDA
jgi:2-polyprenyl-6-methoxyphenol hydroxylase-like FAD-dependent oxidoreductase